MVTVSSTFSLKWLCSVFHIVPQDMSMYSRNFYWTARESKSDLVHYYGGWIRVLTGQIVYIKVGGKESLLTGGMWKL